MKDLNKNELEAMRILWEQGQLKPTEIQHHFSWPIDNGTLRSILKVLVEHDVVTREKSGKVFLYEAKRTRNRILANVTKKLANTFSGGSTKGLIAQLIEAEKLSPEEIEELQKIVNMKNDSDNNLGKGKTS